MRLDYLTIFPDYLDALRLSLPGKAVEKGLLELHVHDLRSWTHDRHRTVDDTPYGGGAGMVLKPEPFGEALDELAVAVPRHRVVASLVPVIVRVDAAGAAREHGEDGDARRVAHVVKELAQRRRRAGAPRLLAVHIVERLVRQQQRAGDDGQYEPA